MTDLRKAAEMALEALEWINRVNAMDYEYQCKAEKPIQALRQALAEPEQRLRVDNDGDIRLEPYPKAYKNKEEFEEAQKKLMKELAQPVDAVNISQERVDETAKREHEPEWVATIGNWGKVEWREDVFPQLGAKLYSAPPKREWVGLTRRELDIATLGLEDLGDCYKAIEAKLKEKNT